VTAVEQAFEPLRAALERTGIRYAIGGSWASTAFGEPRFTNDVDILADLHPNTLPVFLKALPADFYVDLDESLRALRAGRPFNVIYIPTAFKFDFFPARSFPLGLQELERAVRLGSTGLSQSPVPFVSAEDILLAKLHWFRQGGESSEAQWRDIRGVVRGLRTQCDHAYLESGAATLGVSDLLDRALADP
jgi:hypothetical protein